MDKKVLDFQKMSLGLDMPVDQDELLKNIQNMPDDILQIYLSALEKDVEKVLQWKNILTARDKTIQCRFLIENLEQNHLERFNRVVLYLSGNDPLSKAKEINELTFDTPSQESISKAHEVLNLLKTKDIDFGEESIKFSTQSRNLELLSSIFSLINVGGEYSYFFDKSILDKLANQSPESLDNLFELVKSLK